MTARPWNPAAELDGALSRGDLPYAITLATELTQQHGRALDLITALRFLPLVAAHEPERYGDWALRWLARWISEVPATIDRAAEAAALLADLPDEPATVQALHGLVGSS
jgi:hypothetical protein